MKVKLKPETKNDRLHIVDLAPGDVFEFKATPRVLYLRVGEHSDLKVAVCWYLDMGSGYLHSVSPHAQVKLISGEFVES